MNRKNRKNEGFEFVLLDGLFKNGYEAVAIKFGRF